MSERALRPVKIGEHTVGSGNPPLIVAEMSGNHNQSLARALAIIDAAAAAGAHAIKIQTYTADTMTLDLSENEFFISDAQSPWHGRTLYKLYQEAYTPWEWHQTLFERCRQHGMLGFSSPFDESAVEFLESLAVPCYKIASFENTDINLISKVAATGKPLIISTGMASESELEEAVAAARSAGCGDLILLKCTSAYPATAENADVRTIPDLRRRFGCHAGLSDHTPGIGVAIAGIALGAVLVEKHFTLRRADGGVDAAFSLEPEELKLLAAESERAWRALGEVRYGPTTTEMESLVFRRSLYVVKDMLQGEIFTADNVRSIRPGKGLPPKHLTTFLGKKARKPVRRGTPLSWDLIE